MTDEYRKVRARQQNLNRYCRLLATQLTDHERQYIHRRIAEERAALERLVASLRSSISGQTASTDAAGAAAERPQGPECHQGDRPR